MVSIHRKFQAYLDEMQIITILLPTIYYEGHSENFSITNNSECDRIQLTILSRTSLKDKVKYICRTDEKLVIGEQYWIIDAHGGKTDLQIGAVIRTEAFDKEFFYHGTLGYSYGVDKTEFKLWAPTATEVKLHLLSEGAQQPEALPMERRENGVWYIVVKGNLEYCRYSFLVCVNLEWREAVDPYTVSVSLNGEYGIVIDLEKTKITKPLLPLFKQSTDAIIYETHVRDFTIHPNSGIARKGTYLGAAEINTEGMDGVSTGLSYVKELGVTHIEFLPFHDFEGVDESAPETAYNWGYNPLHFNAPDGSYSTDPTAPYTRVNELKAMIHAAHLQGLRVIMDVVYNHVYIREHSSFEKIVPGYFFRHDESGMPSNGTGVGNDFASERLMGRKFIIDSVTYWLEEYEVDGFRFDLMGILDIDTMNEIRKKIDEIDPTVMIIGEGWDLNTPIPAEKKANIRNEKRLPRIGQFNDWFRDTIKGSTFNLYDKGYALGNDRYYEEAKRVLAGSIGIEQKDGGLFSSPVQSVNYVESHDNHTLWDKLTVCSSLETEEFKQMQHRLATAMVLLAQGIPFLHSGQEFFRTKQGIGNSYQSPDAINQLDWDRKSRYMENVEYIRGMIDIRRSHGAFRFSSPELIRKHMQFLSVEKPMIGFMLNEVGEYGEWRKIIVFFNPTFIQKSVVLPEGDWHLLANGQYVNITPGKKLEQPIVTLSPISTYVIIGM
ncbi:type I pullulanase [Cytobacillus sp. FJAT-53684]|uniref:Type I pullulanase n=1 Tax=Cytobacillus mangrovibacter TaxID=3299024 RepID=A0ABW6K233_9BACI